MNLLSLDEHSNLIVAPEAYVIKVFSDILERDKSDKKTQALHELGYVYFMTDYRSDFFDISDKQQRSVEIITNLNFKIDPEDPLILKAIEFCESKKNKLILLLEDANRAIDKIRDYFNEVDLTITDDNGKLIHDSSKLLANVSNLSKVVTGITELEMQVKKSMQTDSKKRGGQEKGVFED